MGKGTISSGGDNNRDAYLSLSVTVLAALCRVPEIASSEDMIFKIPLILEVMSTQYGVFLFFSFAFLDSFYSSFFFLYDPTFIGSTIQLFHFLRSEYCYAVIFLTLYYLYFKDGLAMHIMLPCEGLD